MALALVRPNNVAEHSEAGSNGYNGHGSAEFPSRAALEEIANRHRNALSPESPLSLQVRALSDIRGEYRVGFRAPMIHHIAAAYGWESYSRDVYECFKRVHRDLDVYERYLKLVGLLPWRYYVTVSLRDNLERNSLGIVTFICSYRTPSEIQELKERYHSIFGVQLEADIQRFTDGYHKQLLLARIGIQTPAARHGDGDVEMFELDRITESLHQNFEQITYRSPQMNIIKNIVGVDREDLSDVCDSYLANYGRPLETDLMHEQRGHLEQAILAIMKCSVNRQKYIAEVLHNAMRDPNGWAMRDTSQIDRDMIVNVITTMAQEDMYTMKEGYLLEYGSTLEGDIALAFLGRQDCMEVLYLLLNSYS